MFCMTKICEWAIVVQELWVTSSTAVDEATTFTGRFGIEAIAASKAQEDQ